MKGIHAICVRVARPAVEEPLRGIIEIFLLLIFIWFLFNKIPKWNRNGKMINAVMNVHFTLLHLFLFFWVFISWFYENTQCEHRTQQKGE